VTGENAQQAIQSAGARGRRDLPAEGQDGLFSQTWFAVCLSRDVPAGTVKGIDFLDGRIVVFRGENGQVQALSAYCPHLGADLSVGCVVGNHVQCAFHRWQYDGSGKCVRTGFGSPPPPTAKLFRFPTQERLGIVWVFNGPTPLWELMDFPYPDEALLVENAATEEIRCDGWVYASNTADLQHVQIVHGVQFDLEKVLKEARWDKWGYMCEYDGTHKNGLKARFDRGVRGPSTFIQHGVLDGWWLGLYAGFSCPRPGKHQVFYAMCLLKTDTRAEEHYEYMRRTWKVLVEEDLAILNTIRPRAGTLIRHDLQLAQYFELLRKYPRTHPSASFIK